MPPAGRVKRRRRRPADAAPHAPAEVVLPSVADEIQRLRADVDRLKAQRLNPRFGGAVLDGLSDETNHYSLGFEPRFIMFIANFSQSATVATLGVGCAVVDENVDGGIYQAATSFRRSGSGQFRQSSDVHALLLHGADSQNASVLLAVDSFDIDGFTYTLTGGPAAVMRGFAVGF